MDTTEQETSMPTELRVAGLERATGHLRGALNSVREALSEVSQHEEQTYESEISGNFIEGATNPQAVPDPGELSWDAL